MLMKIIRNENLSFKYYLLEEDFMTFKIYKNRKTRHPSISVKSGDKKRWHNLEITHSPTNDGRYIEIDNPNPKDKKKSYVRKYYRQDIHKAKGYKYKNYVITQQSEKEIKKYLI